MPSGHTTYFEGDTELCDVHSGCSGRFVSSNLLMNRAIVVRVIECTHPCEYGMLCFQKTDFMYGHHIFI